MEVHDTSPPTEAPAQLVSTVVLPRYFRDLVTLVVNLRINVFQRAAQQTTKGPLTPVQVEDLHYFFRVLNNLKISPELKKATALDRILAVAIDDARFHFPPPFPDLARTLRNTWESENWGAQDVIEDEGESEGEVLARLPTDRMRRASAAPSTSSVVNASKRVARRPPATHPIYGEGGIMYGILQIKSHVMRAYSLDDTVPRKSARAFGNNGLAVGACWPLQIAALRDGAHGARVGGIAGHAEEGAFSVVVSGLYSDLDRDLGETIYYSGSKSHENDNPQKPIETAASRTLRQSIRTHRPVRVIRSFSSDWHGRPSAGLRYDGLYEVVNANLALNKKGGQYIQYRLERCRNQVPIVIDRPTPREVQLFEEVKLGY
ncbi:MAG: hypothetical protein M1826_004957 [Phylliscum demangeonii]|nr:MAG: hypothetical protein M1826_004957 [Phylliscum demangeonii]